MTNQINTKKNKPCQQTTPKISTRKNAYQKFIASKEWKAIRKNLFEIRGKQCEICGAKTVQVHHKHYDKPWGEELPEDLIILCGKHHQKAHGIIKEYPNETVVRELHEDLHNVPWCFRMEYKKTTKYRPKKKKKNRKKKPTSCGNCRYFVRFKNDENSTGLCEKKDSRTWVESGKKCKDFKGKPYARIKFKYETRLRKGA